MVMTSKHMMRAILARGAGTAALAITLVSCACRADDTNPDIVLSVNDQPVSVEIANTEASRTRGLAHRHKLDEDSGMLFIFPYPARYEMWMKETYIPLSVAFIDDQGVIINIEKMLPNTLVRHTAVRPAKYALEVNRGWFDAHSVKPGLQVEGIGNAPPAR
jgi:uncharacterized membrane protein (UPF0127 family)